MTEVRGYAQVHTHLGRSYGPRGFSSDDERRSRLHEQRPADRRDERPGLSLVLRRRRTESSAVREVTLPGWTGDAPQPRRGGADRQGTERHQDRARRREADAQGEGHL